MSFNVVVTYQSTLVDKYKTSFIATLLLNKQQNLLERKNIKARFPAGFTEHAEITTTITFKTVAFLSVAGCRIPPLHPYSYVTPLDVNETITIGQTIVFRCRPSYEFLHGSRDDSVFGISSTCLFGGTLSTDPPPCTKSKFCNEALCVCLTIPAQRILLGICMQFVKLNNHEL